MKKITLLILLFVFIAGCTTNTTQEIKMEKEMMTNNSSLEIATLAGGCFWCVEADFEKLEGVDHVVSGYTGGDKENPTYKEVSAGGTGYFEAVQVYYNPKIVSFKEILKYQFHHINPTDDGGQFVDRGKQYRSAIFYHNETQKEVALNLIKELDKGVGVKSP